MKAQTPRKSGSGLGYLWDKLNTTGKISVSVSAVAVIISVLLLYLSFSGINYYEFAFLRSRSTGVVDATKVYADGRYYINPDQEFKMFLATAHSVEFNSVSVFVSDRLELKLSCSLQYFLRKHQMHLLHDNFDVDYRAIAEKRALSALKTTTARFSLREFINDRDRIGDVIFKVIKDRLGGQCCELGCRSIEDNECVGGRCKNYELCTEGCLAYPSCKEEDWGMFVEVRYFHLGRLEIPGSLNEGFLRALILKEEVDTVSFRQESASVVMETRKMVQETINAANEKLQQAKSDASTIQRASKAQIMANIQAAKGEGLVQLFRITNITNPAHRLSFDLSRTLRGHKNVSMAYNFDKYIFRQFGVY